jgi:hypothetical protein
MKMSLKGTAYSAAGFCILQKSQTDFSVDWVLEELCQIASTLGHSEEWLVERHGTFLKRDP